MTANAMSGHVPSIAYISLPMAIQYWVCWHGDRTVFEMEGESYSDHPVLCTPPFLCTLRYNFFFCATMVPVLFLFSHVQYRSLYYQQKSSQTALYPSGKNQR